MKFLRNLAFSSFFFAVFCTVLVGVFMVKSPTYQLAHARAAISDIQHRNQFYTWHVQEHSALAIEAMVQKDHATTQVTEQARSAMVIVLSYHLLIYALIIIWAITLFFIGCYWLALLISFMYEPSPSDTAPSKAT